MGIFSSAFKSSKERERIRKEKLVPRETIVREEPKPLTKREQMIKFANEWAVIDFKDSSLMDLNKMIGMCDLIIDDPSLYKYVPFPIYSERIGLCEKYYNYMRDNIHAEDFFYKIKCAAVEPGKHADLKTERIYMNLYKDLFGFRRSKKDLDAYNELDHIQKSKDRIDKSASEIFYCKNNIFSLDQEKINEEAEKIADEVMKRPTLIDYLPKFLLNEHENSGINSFYDAVIRKHGNSLEFAKKSLAEDRKNGISISKDNLALEKIIKGIDEYYKFLEKGDFYIDTEIQENMSEEEFNRCVDFFEKNVEQSHKYRLYDLDGDETFLGKTDPMIEPEISHDNYEDYIDYQDEYYEMVYGAKPQNLEREFDDNNEEKEGFSYEDYLDGDEYVPDEYLEDYDEESLDDQDGKIIENEERNYLEKIERAGLLGVEFTSLVEKLSSREITPLEKMEEEDIQNKLAQIIAREPNLYVNLPYELANPYKEENSKFYNDLAEQVKFQGIEVGEDIMNDLKAYNNFKERKNRDVPVVNNDLEHDEEIEER